MYGKERPCVYAQGPWMRSERYGLEAEGQHDISLTAIDFF